MYYQKIVTFELLVSCLEMISENYRSAKKKKKKKKWKQSTLTKVSKLYIVKDICQYLPHFGENETCPFHWDFINCNN